MKKVGEKRHVEELLIHRDSKMRRFCNYFVTLFNQKKINPFTQFIQQGKLKAVKATVRENMDMFTSGELKPLDDPSMLAPLKDVPSHDTSVAKDEDGRKVNSTAQQAKEVDEFKDEEGLHYKGSKLPTSKTPGPNLINNRGSISNSELHGRKYPIDLSRLSLNFGGGGSKSNLSSIVHMEEVSAGHLSIERQE